MFVRRLKHETEGEALTFGKAIHKALEHWYTLPQAMRKLSKAEAEAADGLPIGVGNSCALGSIAAFCEAAAPLRALDADNKRSLENGVKILKAYFTKYLDDGLEIVSDQHGPMVERRVSFIIYEDESVVIEYFGTIDMVVKNLYSGHIMVADHKTTSALGAQFYNRIKPNHQYSGYLKGARESLGIDTWLFMVNGIQVAKTKSEFARQITERTEEDFNELRNAVVQAVKHFLDCYNSGVYPQYSPNPCTNYGSCTFLDVCSAPASLRENIIASKFKLNNATTVA